VRNSRESLLAPQRPPVFFETDRFLSRSASGSKFLRHGWQADSRMKFSPILRLLEAVVP